MNMRGDFLIIFQLASIISNELSPLLIAFVYWSFRNYAKTQFVGVTENYYET